MSKPTLRLVLWLGLCSLPLSSCQCLGQTPGTSWTFSESVDLGTSRDVADIAPLPDVSDVGDSGPEVEPSNPVEELECDDALNDRTDLVVDPSGTPWIGYHRYTGPLCNDVSLVVTHFEGGEWRRETIEQHRGLFSVKAIRSDRPVAVYPEPRVGDFRAALRSADGNWSRTNIDLGSTEVGERDGFDLATGVTRYFATFAEDGGERVRLFIYNTSDDRPQWRERSSLYVSDPQAALSQGLRTDGAGHLYLVHRKPNVSGDTFRFGLARYDLASNEWDERTYFDAEYDGAQVHSLEVTDFGSLCMASRLSERLLVTCGTMADLSARERKHFDVEINRAQPASIIEGNDGTLYVAFHPPDNAELRVAELPPRGDWSVRTVFDGSAYGVSTAIAPSDGDLLLAFYTCDDGEQCRMEFIST